MKNPAVQVPSKTPGVQAPVALLLDPQLTPSAKLVWMALRLHADLGPVGPSVVAVRSGLSRPTVRKGIALLVAAGWCVCAPGGRAVASEPVPANTRVTVSGDLLADRRVGIRGKVLYGLLQLTPGFRNQHGQFTYAQLGDRAGSCANTIRQAIRELVQTGWLQAARVNRLAPVRFTLRNPVLARGEAEAERAGRRLEEAPFHGEALMREYLSLLVDSDDFEDNAAPGFLVNPLTNERMELDRFYPPGVAFEYNGPQHYGATDRFSEADAAKQRARDYIKLGICVTRGIRLAVVHPEDLSLETMRRKVGQWLPLRDLSAHGSLIAFLESVSRRYRRAARRGWQQAPVAHPDAR